MRKTFVQLRSRLTWLDALVGCASAAVISVLLVGFRYQSLPIYKIGQTATEDVRALQDLVYEDKSATEERRQAARAAVPAVYTLDSMSILTREREVSKAFADARELLAQMGPAGPDGGSAGADRLLKALEAKVGTTLPAEVLPALLRKKFGSVLEEQILGLLGGVLRDGIVRDRVRFFRDQRIGVVLRDTASSLERPFTEVYAVRDLAGARDYVRQSQLELSVLPPADRAAVLRFLQSVLSPTLEYDAAETEIRRLAAAARVPAAEIQIKEGRTILRSGEEVTQNTLLQLEALRNLQKPLSLLREFTGFFWFVAVMIYAVWRYLVEHWRKYPSIRSTALLVLMLIVLQLLVLRVATSLADVFSSRFEAFPGPYLLCYAVPLAFGAVLITLLVDLNLGVMDALICAILTGLFYQDVAFAAYVLVGCLCGIYSIRQYRNRAAVLTAGLAIGIINGISLLGIDAFRQVPFEGPLVLNQMGMALLNGFLSAALISMLLPALESLFRITTDIRLLELSNLNAPVLRRLAVEAPGTYHHSLMVGTLAEAAAEAIGANPLLVRVSAYYHDLGKMLNPEYFIENQAFGPNKHENLSPNMSRGIIANHVKDGMELARQIGLAPQIRDMIPQHHGTRVMTYFYRKAKDSTDCRGDQIEESDFRYAGPKPQTKEAAIMMMADGVEAASRTLTNPNTAQIQAMIEYLVSGIVSDGQLEECDITLQEVRLVKESFFKILSGIYHRRIDYPGYDFKDIAHEVETRSVQSPSAG